MTVFVYFPEVSVKKLSPCVSISEKNVKKIIKKKKFLTRLAGDQKVIYKIPSI